MRIHFASREHRDFYHDMMAQSRRQDCYHQAFFYVMGIAPETRANIRQMFNFQQDCIEPEGMHGGWQTSGTVRVCQLPLICGMVTAQSDRVMNLPQMTCFAVSLRRTSWKALNCVTRNIAGS